MPLGSTVAQICSVSGTSQAESVREAWTAHAGCVSSAAWPVKLDVMDQAVSLYCMTVCVSSNDQVVTD